MSTRHYSWAWRQSVSALARYVLLALVERSDQSGECWPSVETIAGQTGLNEKTVRRHLTELEAAGAIERHRRHRKDGTRTSDRIVLVYVDIGLAVTESARQGLTDSPVPTPGMTSGLSVPDYRSESPRKIPPVDPTTSTDPKTEDQDLVLDVEKRPSIRGGHSARIIADLERRRRRHAGGKRTDEERTDEEPA
jgi:DNA-binding transcriptional regulator YhcF (GntR family)